MLAVQWLPVLLVACVLRSSLSLSCRQAVSRADPGGDRERSVSSRLSGARGNVVRRCRREASTSQVQARSDASDTSDGKHPGRQISLRPKYTVIGAGLRWVLLMMQHRPTQDIGPRENEKSLLCFGCVLWLAQLREHRRRLHRDNRELRPGTHARTGANVRFAPVPFMAVL